MPQTATAEEIRAGSRVLEIFVNPLNVRVMRAHLSGSQRLSEVMSALGWAAESTVRAAVVGLCEKGVLRRGASTDSSYGVATELTDGGRELLFVADILEVWLTHSPTGPVSLESEEAKSAVKALAGGWGTTLIRELASHSTTLTELSRAIPDIPYPVLERRITWMKMTGQIEAVERTGRGTPYVATKWLRQAIAPICASVRCERRHFDDGAIGAVTEIEVEAAFLMAMGLTNLPPNADGACTLAVQTDRTVNEDIRPLAGVAVSVRDGDLLSFSPDISGPPSTWVVGTYEAWLDAVIDGRIEGLRLGGEDPQLALDLVAGLHLALFDFAQRRSIQPTAAAS